MLTDIEEHNRQYRSTKPLPTQPQEKPTNKHAELIREARELAGKLDGFTAVPFTGGRPGGTVTHTPPTDDVCYHSSTMLIALVEIIEEQDKQPRFDENLKAIKEQLDDIERRIGVQDVCRGDRDVH